MRISATAIGLTGILVYLLNFALTGFLGPDVKSDTWMRVQAGLIFAMPLILVSMMIAVARGRGPLPAKISLVQTLGVAAVLIALWAILFSAYVAARVDIALVRQLAENQRP